MHPHFSVKQNANILSIYLFLSVSMKMEMKHLKWEEGWQINVCSCQRIGGKSSPGLSLRQHSLKIPTRGGGLRFFIGDKYSSQLYLQIQIQYSDSLKIPMRGGRLGFFNGDKQYDCTTVLFNMYVCRVGGSLGIMPSVEENMCTEQFCAV